MQKIKINNISQPIVIFLTSFFPISLLMGSLIINLNIFLIIFFFIILVLNKKISINLNLFFLPITILFVSLIINIFFNSGEMLSYERQISFLRFVLLVIALSHIIELNNYKFEKIIYKSWFFVFCIVTFDLYFEFTFGFLS